MSSCHRPRSENLCLAGDLLVSQREALDVLLNLAVVSQELDIGAIDQDTALLLQLDIFVASQGGETPVLADNDLLATGELVHGSSESLDGGGAVGVASPDGQKDLADVDTGDTAVGLAPSTSHSRLQSIGTGARQHLVDTDDVEGVGADSEVETFFTGNLDKVLVGADAGGFEGFGTQLLVLVGHHVHAEGEFVDIGTLSSKIEDTNLRVGHTTVESRLGVGLVLAVAVASSRTSGHLDGCVVR